MEMFIMKGILFLSTIIIIGIVMEILINKEEEIEAKDEWIKLQLENERLLNECLKNNEL